VRLRTGRHRRARTLSVAAAVAVAAGAGGVHLGLSGGGAEAAATTVTVAGTAQLESAVRNATAGTVIQVRGGTYYPTATLKSTADGTASARITLRAYGSEKVRIDWSGFPVDGRDGRPWCARGRWFAALDRVPDDRFLHHRVDDELSARTPRRPSPTGRSFRRPRGALAGGC
jgi:hypothetical protein